jgi:hypothetical protein
LKVPTKLTDPLTFFFFFGLVRLKEKMALEAQASRNLPELMFWEDHLGMKIGGAGVTENGEPVADHLKITFTNIDNSKADKEHWFVLCFITREYEGMGAPLNTLLYRFYS